MDHSLQLPLGLYAGRSVTYWLELPGAKFSIIIFIPFDIIGSHLFTHFPLFIFNFRFEGFVLKLVTINVCCAVLIFSFILWRRLFVSSTNMHTCRSVVLRMHKINMKVSSFSVFCCFAMYSFFSFRQTKFFYYYQSKFQRVPEFLYMK
jgi:hypothetical protein